MDEMEIDVGIVYPFTYLKKRARAETKAFVRDKVSVRIPCLSPSEAPIVVAGSCLLRNGGIIHSDTAFERRLFGDHLLNQAKDTEGERLKYALERLAAGNLGSVFGRRVFSETQFHPNSAGAKPALDAFPLDAETIVVSHRDEVRTQAIAELSKCAIVDGRLYFPDVTPDLVIYANGGFAMQDGLNDEFSFVGPMRDTVVGFHFALHHETEAMQARTIINGARGGFASDSHYKLDTLDKAVSERQYIPEALLNAYTAAKFLLFEAGPYFSRMDAEGVECLAQVIRQRDRLETGDEQAYWVLSDVVKMLHENNSFVAEKYASARSMMQRTTTIVSAALEFTAKPKTANEIAPEVGDGLEHLTGF